MCFMIITHFVKSICYQEVLLFLKMIFSCEQLVIIQDNQQGIRQKTVEVK